MERVPEPELMEGAEQAEAYALADFADVNQRFVDQFRARFPDLVKGEIADLGAGPADIPIRLAKTLPHVHIVAIDGSVAMLEHAKRSVREQKLEERVEIILGIFPGAVPGARKFDAVISNSLLHHLADPGVLWREVKLLARPGAAVFVVDLMRPDSRETAREIVEVNSGDEREILKTDFYNSLLAAFTVEEVQAQLAAAHLDGLRVEAISDRHVMISGRTGLSP